MGRRRRSLLILLFVLGLTAASAIVISSKRTVLGLDLRGGTQLIYQAEETARTPTITPDDIDRAIDIIRERADKLGVSEPEISRLGEKGIQVGLPDVQNAQQAIEQIGTTSQLYFYDFEGNVVPPPGPNVPDDPTQPPGPINPAIYSFPNLYDAVEFASKRKAECPQERVHDQRADPLPVRAQLPPAPGRPRGGADGSVPAVPQRGAAARLADHLRAPGDGGRPGTDPRTRPSRRASARSRPRPTTCSRIARRCRGTTSRTPSRAPIRPPTSRTSPSTSPMTAAPRSRRSPETIARARRARPPRRASASARQRRGVLPALLGRARRPGRHRADHQLRREPDRDRRAHRGPDLRQFHDQLGAGPGRVPAHRRAADQPPAREPEHRLGDARPAGARPGAPRRGHRPDPGRLLPGRLLPHAGSDRDRRPGRVRGDLLRPGQADPDHAHPARASPG